MSPRPVIEYYFSFISLWSYIGNRRLFQLAEKHNAQIRYKPIDLMRIFSLSGGLPVAKRSQQRQAYRLLEMKRWTLIRDIPIVEHPRYYPADPSLAHRFLLAALEQRGHDSGPVQEFVQQSLGAVWAEELDVANPMTIQLLAKKSRISGIDELLERAETDDSLAKLELSRTEEAISNSYFGAPVYVYRGEPFWGQDRLEMLDDVLGSGREPYQLPTE